MKINIDLSEDGSKVQVKFDFDMEAVQKVKSIPGARFVNKEKGGPYWTVPAEVESVRRLQAIFGSDLRRSKQLKGWIGERLSEMEKLSKLALADDAHLHRLGDVLPALYDALYPYQRAGVAYCAAAPHPLIADQPGLGKTLEVIGGIHEAELDEGKHLVIAPKTALETVWMRELERWQDHAIFVATGEPSERRATIWEFTQYEYPAWLIVNPAMAQLVRRKDRQTGDIIEEPRWPELFDIVWDTCTIDEVHTCGLRNIDTLTAKGLLGLNIYGKKIAMSGTPMGGKPINLWPILHLLYPEEYASKWRWAGQWLYIEDTGYGKKIGDVRPDKREEFDRWLTPYMIRRTKAEVFPQLPDKQYVPVWVEMSDTQKKQYDEFALRAEVKIEDEQLTATSILAEYTRLKQFAISHSKIRWDSKSRGEFKVIPSGFKDSAKLDALEELLAERGVFEEGGQDTAEQIMIFSQFSEIVDWVHEWLVNVKKVPAVKLTGATTQRGRKEVEEDFQAGEAKVAVMSTKAGGQSITMDAADTAIFMDETWVPDDQEQAEDRVHRVSRIHQVTCYYLRTKGTIEEYIYSLVGHKAKVNTRILDLRRKGLKATA